MKFRPNPLLAAFLAIGSTSLGHAQVPEVRDVKAAIVRLLAKPVSAITPDLTLVTDFAQKSDKVQVHIVNGLVSIDRTKNDALLLGYYVVGSVRYDLDHSQASDDRVPEEVSAVRASLLMYRAIQHHEKGFNRPVLDKLAAWDKKGRLSQYVRSVDKDAGKKK